MRKLIVLFILVLFSADLSYGQLSAKVDERVELTGVVFRLARIPEYTQGRIESYNEDIETYFDDFRYNDLTEYVVKLRNENRLGYSAVASSALFLSIENGKVILNPHLSVNRLPGYGDQWPEGSFERYVALLNDFYERSDFHKFYMAHEKLYEQVTDAIDRIFADFNAGWFADFFGVEFQYPGMYVAMGNGPSNYYIPDYETEAGYGIVIGGRQRYDPDSLSEVTIHEICHHYSNPLFYAYWENPYTFVIPIEPWRLEKNKKYKIVLGSHLFRTDDYCNIPEDYIITYSTQEVAGAESRL